MKGLMNLIPKFLVFCWLCNIAADVHADTNEIIAKGFAVIADDKIEARRIALEDAKRQALEQGLGVFIESKTTSENFILAKDEIFTRASGRLSSYRIIEEKENPDNTLEITIAAQLPTKTMQTDIQEVIRKLGFSQLPGLAIEIAAEGQAAKHVGSIKSALIRMIKRQGFPVKTDIEKVASGGFTLQISLKLDEERAEYQGLELTSYTAHVELTAKRPSDATILASEASAYRKPGQNSAKVVKGYVNKELKSAWKSLHKQILNHWYEEQQSGRTIIVKLKAPKDEAAILGLIQTLKSQVFGISDARLLTVNNGYGTIETIYYGWPEQLYSQLAKTKTITAAYQLNALENEQIILQ